MEKMALNMEKKVNYEDGIIDTMLIDKLERTEEDNLKIVNYFKVLVTRKTQYSKAICRKRS